MSDEQAARAINAAAPRLREISEALADGVPASILSIDGIEIATIYPTSQPVPAIKGTLSWEVMAVARVRTKVRVEATGEIRDMALAELTQLAAQTERRGYGLVPIPTPESPHHQYLLRRRTEQP